MAGEVEPLTPDLVYYTFAKVHGRPPRKVLLRRPWVPIKRVTLFDPETNKPVWSTTAGRPWPKWELQQRISEEFDDAYGHMVEVLDDAYRAIGTIPITKKYTTDTSQKDARETLNVQAAVAAMFVLAEEEMSQIEVRYLSRHLGPNGRHGSSDPIEHSSLGSAISQIRALGLIRHAGVYSLTTSGNPCMTHVASISFGALFDKYKDYVLTLAESVSYDERSRLITIGDALLKALLTQGVAKDEVIPRYIDAMATFRFLKMDGEVRKTQFEFERLLPGYFPELVDRYRALKPEDPPPALEG